MAPHGEGLAFTRGPYRQIGNGLELGNVGQPQDAPVDLDAGKAERVAPHLLKVTLQQNLGPEGVPLILEQLAAAEYPRALGTQGTGAIFARPILGRSVELSARYSF